MSSLQALRLENERLKAELADRDATIADLHAKVEKLSNDIHELRCFVNRVLAGRRTSPRDHENQTFLFGEVTNEAANLVSSEDDMGLDAIDDEQPDPKPRGEQRNSKQKPKLIDASGLPTVEVIHELPLNERFCPMTGLPLVEVGEEITQEIDYQRAELRLVLHKTIVYGLPEELANERKIEKVKAPTPPRALEGCVASAMLLAWLLVQKYANHLPLYRQQEIFKRDGLFIARQRLCDWALGAASALEPIVERLMHKIRAGPVMQLDDTPIMCQGGKGEKNYQAYLWTFVNPKVSGVVYRFTEGRSADLIAPHLMGFEGTLVGDGYSGNAAAARKAGGRIQLAGCFAHTTRKFRDACDAPCIALLFRNDIKQLYAVEDEADAAQASDDERLALRQEKSRPIFARLLSRARRIQHNFNESSSMGRALGYVVNQRRALRRFLEDGSVPLDNNACENAVRPAALGRRNWLFFGSPRGGRAAATMYSLLESCKIEKVDPIDYLADVLVRVATHPASDVEELLPANWRATVARAKAQGTSSLALAAELYS